MISNTDRRFGKTIRNTMQVLGAAAIIGTTGCASPANSYNAQAVQDKQPEVYTIKGLPISVASTCKYGPTCYLSLVLYDQNHEKQALVTSASSDQPGITLLEAVIESEIVDEDTEPIKVTLDKDFNIERITVESVDYQP